MTSINICMCKILLLVPLTVSGLLRVDVCHGARGCCHVLKTQPIRGGGGVLQPQIQPIRGGGGGLQPRALDHIHKYYIIYVYTLLSAGKLRLFL
jgi:hypothetical protein